jgi:hypothetical protein
MTILEATGKLVEHFTKNDTFELGADFMKVVLISDNDGDKATILCALDALVNEGLVIKKDFNGKDYWSLVRPLAYQNQQITIPLTLAVDIANFLNNCEPKDDSRCNALHIEAQDLFNILLVAKKH